MLYKGRICFRQYIPKKHKRFGIKPYKHCDPLGYTYDVSMYLGKQQQHATTHITAMHGAVLQVLQRDEGMGHKIYLTNYFTSLALFTICSNKKSMCVEQFAMTGMECCKDIGPKSLKVKMGDIVTRDRGTLRLFAGKRRDVYILTNTHAPLVEGNFNQESDQPIKPCVVEYHNAYVGFVDSQTEWSRPMEMPTEQGSGPSNCLST